MMGVVSVFSSPLYSSSNGLVEQVVQMVKSWIAKSGSFYCLLWVYSSTSLQSGFMPAELILGSRIGKALPTLVSEGKPDVGTFERKDQELKRQ